MRRPSLIYHGNTFTVHVYTHAEDGKTVEDGVVIQHRILRSRYALTGEPAAAFAAFLAEAVADSVPGLMYLVVDQVCESEVCQPYSQRAV